MLQLVWINWQQLAFSEHDAKLYQEVRFSKDLAILRPVMYIIFHYSASALSFLMPTWFSFVVSWLTHLKGLAAELIFDVDKNSQNYFFLRNIVFFLNLFPNVSDSKKTRDSLASGIVLSSLNKTWKKFNH